MKVGFYIGRLTYAAQFGPTADYFRSKGAQITLFCDYRQEPAGSGYKSYLYPYTEQIQKILPEYDLITFRSIKELADSIKMRGIQVMFFSVLDGIAKEVKTFADEAATGLIIARLQWGLEIMAGKDLECTDIVLSFCDTWKELWKKWLTHFKMISKEQEPNIFEQIEAKTVSCGFAQADQIKDYDRKKICKKYGIPSDKKLLVYLPFPWRIEFSVWSHILYKPQNKAVKTARLLWNRAWKNFSDVFGCADDLQVARAIRQFADRNNAFFVVKGRVKNKIPRYLRKIADKVVFDDSFYPYTTMELMYAADICVNFYSEVNKESIICGTPCVCLGPKNAEDWPSYASRFAIEELSRNPESFYNFDGVVYNESVDDFAKDFGSKTFDDYAMNQKNKDEFIKKFLGFDDFKTCERIYYCISGLLAGKKV